MENDALARQAAMLGNRARKSFQRLQPIFERRGVGAFRLYDRDIPEVRAVVDWYEGHLVLAEYAREQTAGVPGWLEAMGGAVAQALEVPVARLHLKRRRTRPTEGERYGRAEGEGGRLAVRELGLRFWVELDEHIDTGLFADHRETRARLRAESAGKSFLNLFGYTGSFTCASAAGGARGTVTVDASRTYLRWAQDNLELNRLQGAHELVRADAREWLLEAAQAGRRFGLCLLDPPSFSTREGAPSFDVLRDHRRLVEQALSLLEPGGVLYFSTNHQRFQPDLASLRCAELREITAETVPVDYRNKQVHRCFRIAA
jgi:23S rRNA (cytosine1962-C5)-methyltransferase